MSGERQELKERVNAPRMPMNVYEQLMNLPDIEYREEICGALAARLTIVLESGGIEIGGVSLRPKTEEGIKRKAIRRCSIAPLRDIYGIRFITEETERMRIAGLIQSGYPATPKTFPNGLPSIREYADPAMRDLVRSRFNPALYREGSAMHINIVFLRAGETVYDIAEVQIMTPREMEIFHQTRYGYENGRH